MTNSAPSIIKLLRAGYVLVRAVERTSNGKKSYVIQQSEKYGEWKNIAVFHTKGACENKLKGIEEHPLYIVTH